MNDFLQMDIFFFISSLIAIVFLLLITIVGIYVFLIIKKVHAVTKEFKELSTHFSQKGKETTDQVSSKIEAMLSNAGTVEKIIATIMGTVLAYYFGFRGKIKKDARKK